MLDNGSSPLFLNDLFLENYLVILQGRLNLTLLFFKSEFSYFNFEYCWRIILQGRLNGRDLYKMQKPRPERSNFSHFTTWWRNFLLLFNCFPFQSWLRIQQNSALFPLFSLFSCLFKHWKYMKIQSIYEKKQSRDSILHTSPLFNETSKSFINFLFQHLKITIITKNYNFQFFTRNAVI